MCKVSKDQEEMALSQCKKINDLKSLINFNSVDSLDIEDPVIFPKAERFLTVVWSGQGAQ